ncbi:MAG TPA: glycoside-pentoside-hexuronide (GPH):cation symporter, partial [Gammaproteobacteria bacterium]
MGGADKVPFKEKLAYGMGDAAFNFIWMTFVYYQLFFYTDIFGISAAAAGTLLLTTRVWDTISDPLIGFASDRTRSRWGQFRPYLLFGAIPLGMASVLCFTTPDLPPTGKLYYAYATYLFLGIVFTANNIPYSSLLGVISPNSRERAALSSYRFIGAYGAGIIVLYFTLDLVELLGQGDRPKGFQLTMSAYALVTVILLLITFHFTRERVRPVMDRQTPFSRDLLDILANGPFMILFAVGIFTLAFVSIR